MVKPSSSAAPPRSSAPLPPLLDLANKIHGPLVPMPPSHAHGTHGYSNAATPRDIQLAANELDAQLASIRPTNNIMHPTPPQPYLATPVAASGFPPSRRPPRDAFEEADKDGDGRLDRSEFAAFLKKQAAPPPPPYGYADQPFAHAPSSASTPAASGSLQFVKVPMLDPRANARTPSGRARVDPITPGHI